MFKVLDEVCKPKRATKDSSCIDLFAREDVVIGAGDTEIVPLGVKIDLDALCLRFYGGKYSEFKNGEDSHNNLIIQKFEHFLSSHCLELKCRSSLPLKKGLIVANGVGEIDLDCPDEIGIFLHNPISYLHIHGLYYKDLPPDDFNPVYIKKGEKIAQIKLVEHKSYLMGYESEEVRDGGLGQLIKKKI